jgi:hypothetical protein
MKDTEKKREHGDPRISSAEAAAKIRRIALNGASPRERNVGLCALQKEKRWRRFDSASEPKQKSDNLGLLFLFSASLCLQRSGWLKLTGQKILRQQ